MPRGRALRAELTSIDGDGDWVRDTGELYLVRHGTHDPGAARVEIVAHIPDGVELARRLEGWSGAQGRPGSGSWLRHRAGRPTGAGRSRPRAVRRR